jgi:uncharacterized protein (DUF1800 family)
MGNDKPLHRKEFFKKLLGSKKKELAATSGNTNFDNENEDPLFKKYSRKTLGVRQYSERIELPRKDGTFSARVGAVTSGLAPYTGAWTSWEVNYLLRRLSFGAKRSDTKAMLAMSVSDAVDSLLSYSLTPIKPSPTPLYFNGINYKDTLGNGTGTPIISGGVSQGADWTNSNITGYPPFGPNYSRRISLEYWNWGVMLSDATSIREKMQQFWFHFIPINFESLENSEMNSAIVSYEYTKLLRQNALGNFKTLIKAISKTPAMLVYLSNQYSTAAVPNENFARELLELFTMGKTPTQNYTEQDIIAASKVFSGWRVPTFMAATKPASAFNSVFHNQTNKVFSSNFVSTAFPTATIDNQTGANGANEFDQFFEMLFAAQTDTIAKYVCRRLYRYFVYYDIDANIEANVIVPLSATLISSNWEMMPVVRQLFKSQHFFDLANRGVMIKSPIDYIAGILRTLNINTEATTVNTADGSSSLLDTQYFTWRFFQGYCESNLGQGIGLPPNVAGWKAYYQGPTYYQNWINSETIQKRSILINYLLSTNGFTPYQGTLIKVDLIAYVQQYDNGIIANGIVANPITLINEVVKSLLPVDIPVAYKTNQLKNIELLNGQADTYWTNAWNLLSSPSNTTLNTNLVNARLRVLFTAVMQLAEFQLM